MIVILRPNAMCCPEIYRDAPGSFFEDILHVKTVISHFNTEFKGRRIFITHDDMKISDMLFHIVQGGGRF